MEKIYLVDVSSLFFRAFFAVPPLTAPNGQPVNAVYGLLNMTAKLLKEERPKFLIFCFDRKEPSFRNELFSDYKAHREEMPEDLQKQMPYIRRLADLLGIPSVDFAGFEADDLIGTLTRRAREDGRDVVIVSGDKDFAQLISPHVQLYDTMRGVRMGPAEVQEKWGICPSQMRDYLAIVGDSSDNIPGVRGIGEKGAIKLLKEFPTLETIYDNLEKISGKSLKEKLLQAREMAFLSKDLVTIRTNVPLAVGWEKYQLSPIKKEELRSLLQELNFKSLEGSLLGAEPEVDPSLDATIKFKLEEVNAALLENRLHTGDEFWIFFDTRGIYLLKYEDPERLIFQFSGDPHSLGELLTRFAIVQRGYDLKSLWGQIYSPSTGPKLRLSWDSMLAAYVLRATDCSDFKKVYEKFLGKNYAELSDAKYLVSAQLDLFCYLKGELERLELLSVAESIEFPLIPVLYRMESFGVGIDSELLMSLSRSASGEISNLEDQIYKLAKHSFNIASPKQLAHVLFEEMSLPTHKKTKTGFSTDNEVLEKISHPIAKLVLEFREISKLKNTYLDPLPNLVHKQDGRIHTTFNQALTSTGRLSSEKPNLQNIPIRTERGSRVRQAFVAKEGCRLLSLDYSQIELRILAHISQDPGLIRAFKKGEDIHSATAAEIFSVSHTDITSNQRRIAKAVNFGIAYGQGAFGLSETLHISRGEAQKIILRYFDKFPHIKTYIDETIKSAHQRGYVETLLGRRRYLDELKSSNQAIVKFGERAAINAPIQGTASDLVKKAMIEIDKFTNLSMILQVHDELVFEGDEVLIQKDLPRLISAMEGILALRVPLKVNYGVGTNWEAAHNN